MRKLVISPGLNIYSFHRVWFCSLMLGGLVLWGCNGGNEIDLDSSGRDKPTRQQEAKPLDTVNLDPCSPYQEQNKNALDWNRPRSQERSQERAAMATYIQEYYGLQDEMVLEAIRKVPRHWFVPKPYRPYAYSNRPLPIGYDQTISQPFIVAYMTSQLRLQPGDKVLEIGTGSGYQAAVLNELTPEVYTIEIVEPLARRTAALLKEKGYTAVTTKTGDGYQGWSEYAPFDAIIVTAAPEKIPPALIEQLAQGGRMILPVGGQYAEQELLLITRKKEGSLQKETLMPVRFVPMVSDDEQKPE